MRSEGEGVRRRMRSEGEGVRRRMRVRERE